MHVPSVSLSSFSMPTRNGLIAGEDPGLVTAGRRPVKSRVLIFRKNDYQPIRLDISLSDGTWKADQLDPADSYFVVAFDRHLHFNAVIRDNIKPAEKS